MGPGWKSLKHILFHWSALMKTRYRATGKKSSVSTSSIRMGQVPIRNKYWVLVMKKKLYKSVYATPFHSYDIHFYMGHITSWLQLCLIKLIIIMKLLIILCITFIYYMIYIFYRIYFRRSFCITFWKASTSYVIRSRCMIACLMDHLVVVSAVLHSTYILWLVYIARRCSVLASTKCVHCQCTI